MKFAIFGIIVTSLLSITSRKKSSSNPGGSWTFQGLTYNTFTCSRDTFAPFSLGSVCVSTNKTSNGATLSVGFNANPTASGTYTIQNANAAGTANTVLITLIPGDSSTLGAFTSTGGNGTETVNVVIAGGKMSVSGSGIIMATPNSAGNLSDSSAINFNITQTE